MREEKAEFIWLDGTIVPWADAKLHVHTQCVLGGLNVYEGIKAYWNPEQEELYVFRFDTHLKRLARSLKMVRMALPYSLGQLEQATLDLLARNRFRQDVSIRLVCYFGEGELFGYLPDEIETGAFIYSTSRSGVPAVNRGIHCCVSSWHRLSDATAPPRIKAGANYQNVRLAQVQARVDGYDEPILLNESGKVAEAPVRNVAIVRDGVLATPDVSSGILEGVTRATMLELASDQLGIRVEERTIDRTELYVADEVFLTSSSLEALPVLSIDRLTVGDGRPGPVALAVSQALSDAGSGRNPAYLHWLTPVYRPAARERKHSGVGDLD